MFPTFDFDNNIETTNEETESPISLGRVFIMDFNNGKAIVRMENGKPVEAKTIKEKVQTYIKVLLNTQYEKYRVYKDTGFGMTYFNYLGYRDLDKGFIHSELKREITEKIKALDVISDVIDFSAHILGTTLNVVLTVNLIDETSATIQESVVI
ncbi:DUF2634 domain-containing protein [Anaerovorax odorimutans]|uniref:DUF2634 domain-containing protein n=1 Tax=Anaerovorax odorimutans TaxID=109327 RepID=UPI0003FA2D5D|nr:DUF2634 domain-containing protein [Anaerovorax odorimutans]